MPPEPKSDLDQIASNERMIQTLNTQLSHPGLDPHTRGRIEHQLTSIGRANASIRERSVRQDRANFQ